MQHCCSHGRASENPDWTGSALRAVPVLYLCTASINRGTAPWQLGVPWGVGVDVDVGCGPVSHTCRPPAPCLCSDLAITVQGGGAGVLFLLLLLLLVLSQCLHFQCRRRRGVENEGEAKAKNQTLLVLSPHRCVGSRQNFPSRQDHCGLANHGTTVLAAPRRTDPIGCSLIVPAGSRVPPPAGPGARCCRYRVLPRAIFRPGPGATVPSYWHLPPFGWHRNLRPRPSSLQTTLHSGPAANSGRSCLLSLALAVQGGGGGGGDLPPPPRRLTPLCKLFIAGLSLIPPSLSSRHASRTPIRTRGEGHASRERNLESECPLLEVVTMPSRDHGKERNNLMEPRDHWCLDERLLDRSPRPLFPSGPHLCECHGRYRNPAGRPPPVSARCPVRSVSRRGSVRSQVPSHAPPGAPTTTALSSAPVDRATAQLSSAKSAWLVISRLARAGLAPLQGFLPSTKQGLRPVPPFQFQPFVPPGPFVPSTHHAPHPVACSCCWPGLVVRFHLSHLPRFLLSSSSSPLPARHRIPGIPLRFDDVVPLNAITTRRPLPIPDRPSNRTERTSRGSACLPMLTVS